MCVFPSIENNKKPPIFSWFLTLETTRFWLPSQSFVKSSMYQKSLGILVKLLILVTFLMFPFALSFLKQPVKQTAGWLLAAEEFLPMPVGSPANLPKTVLHPSHRAPRVASCPPHRLGFLSSLLFFFQCQVTSRDKELLVIFSSQGEY